eukprot:scaffold100018_cov36-Phaeocystis_antarctica.AAC.1
MLILENRTGRSGPAKESRLTRSRSPPSPACFDLLPLPMAPRPSSRSNMASLIDYSSVRQYAEAMTTDIQYQVSVFDRHSLKVVGAGLYGANFGRDGYNGAAAMAACRRRS